MKSLAEGEEMPMDFWNYKVNPIVGFYIEKEEGLTKRMEKKYWQTSKPI